MELVRPRHPDPPPFQSQGECMARTVAWGIGVRGSVAGGRGAVTVAGGVLGSDLHGLRVDAARPVDELRRVRRRRVDVQVRVDLLVHLAALEEERERVAPSVRAAHLRGKVSITVVVSPARHLARISMGI